MKNNLPFWILFIVFLSFVGFFLFSVSDVLTPFIFSFVIAYIVNPAVKKLESIGLSRLFAVILIFLFIMIIATFLIILIVPLAYYQSVSFILKIPEYINIINAFYNKYLPEVNKYVSREELQRFGMSVSSDITEYLSILFTGLWTSGKAIFTAVFFIFLIPVIMFHSLYQWENVAIKIKKLIPFRYQDIFTQEINNIDDAISGYIRGQFIVCIFASTYYSIAFTYLGLNHGVFLGLISGLLTFIPYVGSTFCFVASHVIAFTQFESMIDVVSITVAYLIQQIFEIAFLIPFFVGHKIKLHPLWIIFSIFAGGAFVGFIGVLLALPFAAVTGVLVRTMIKKYFSTDFYATKTITTDK